MRGRQHRVAAPVVLPPLVRDAAKRARGLFVYWGRVDDWKPCDGPLVIAGGPHPRLHRLQFRSQIRARGDA